MKINNNFFCVLNIEESELGLLSLPSLITKGKYLPLFIFPKTSTGIEEIVEEGHIHFMSQQRAMTFVNHLVAKHQMLSSINTIIFIGLNDAQKSYLDYFNKFNVIFIDDKTDMEFILHSFRQKDETLKCRSDELIKGVYKPILSNSNIEIDEEAQSIDLTNRSEKLIVIENCDSCAPITAINYASYVEANIEVIAKPTIKRKEIQNLIYLWKKTANQNHFNDLSASIYPSVEELDFTNYSVATFFTYGVPYPLILKNVIPMTMVNTSFIPENFVFNSVINQINKYHNAAVVFSPKEFDEEETEFLISTLDKSNLYVQPLIGEEATVYNTDNTILEFPFDILHICSHGGEVSGYNVKDSIRDRYGDYHDIEYDEVVSIKIKSDETLEDKINVTSKFIWRKFNGLIWHSKELKEKGYSHETYADVLHSVGASKTAKRTAITQVDDSAAIKCFDGNYQAMISHIGGNHTYPFIFNNTCWSWLNIAEGFLSTGSSGYIGTLWNIKNRTAIDVAKTFYENLFDKSISNNLYDSIRENTIHQNDENIFIFWGLPDSFIYDSIEPEPKKYIASKLAINYANWKKWLDGGMKAQYKRSVNDLVDWNIKIITKYFNKEFINILTK